MRAQPLELVGADRRQHVAAGAAQVGVDEAVVHLPHGEPRPLAPVPQPLAAARHHDRGEELVCLAAQRLQLLAGRFEGRRLVEQRPLQASTESAPTTIASGCRPDTFTAFISARVEASSLRCGPAAQAARDLLLVDAAGLDGEVEAGTGQQLAAGGAGRGEDEGRAWHVLGRERYAGSSRNSPPSSLWVTR
jgi:hypothetical protein